MEALNVPTAPAADLMQIVGAMGMPSRSSPVVAGGNFAGLFQVLMQGMGDGGTVSDPLLWAQEAFDLAKPDSKKTSQWEMLMALLAAAPGQMDFRQYAMAKLEDGAKNGAQMDLGAMQEIGALGPDSFGRWFTLADALALLGETYEDESTEDALEALADPADTGGAQDAFALAAMAEGLPGTVQGAAIMKPEAAELRTQEAGAVGALTRLDEDWEAAVSAAGYARQGAGEGKAGNEEALLGQEQFRQAVQEAKGKLAGKEAKGKDDATAREILFGENVRRIHPNGFMAAGPRQVGGPGIPEQIMDGLSSNLQAGKGEFVLKLVPEGLGEITVKLLANEGKTTLRIITASAETARLINNDIQALQNALRPIQVEVREAVPQAEESREAGGYFPGFDQFSQFDQFNQYRSRGEPGQRSGGRRGGTQPVQGLDEAAGVSPAQAMAAALPGADLDMYV
ncbi:MAG: flagellar hook-length control protein FliK [Clostridiales bacterium]|nr:flagellar hook-length control protein FliK [Clostridiales bacterium]